LQPKKIIEGIAGWTLVI